MFGNGTNKTISQTTDSKAYIMKTEQFTFTGASSTSTSTPAGWNPKFEGPDGKNYTKINPKFYTENGTSTSSFNTGEKYFCTYDLDTTGSSVVEISANSFPGTLTLGHHCGIKQINLVNCWKTKFMAA